MPKRTGDWVPKEQRAYLTCKECKKNLPREQFISEGVAPSGLRKFSSRCRKCYYPYAKQNWKGPVYDKLKLFDYVASKKIKCAKCGYDKCTKALDFHHVDPNKKDKGITELINLNSTIEQIDTEIEKCIVLCSNCHREYHAGVWSLNETIPNNS